jgi:hypothetical protein
MFNSEPFAASSNCFRREGSLRALLRLPLELRYLGAIRERLAVAWIVVVEVALSRGPKITDVNGGDTASSRFMPRDRFTDNLPGPHVAAVTTDGFVWCRLAVSDAWVALPDFYNVTVRIANIAARLAVLGLWLRDKFGPSLPP